MGDTKNKSDRDTSVLYIDGTKVNGYPMCKH